MSSKLRIDTDNVSPYTTDGERIVKNKSRNVKTVAKLDAKQGRKPRVDS